MNKKVSNILYLTKEFLKESKFTILISFILVIIGGVLGIITFEVNSDEVYENVGRAILWNLIIYAPAYLFCVFGSLKKSLKVLIFLSFLYIGFIYGRIFEYLYINSKVLGLISIVFYYLVTLIISLLFINFAIYIVTPYLTSTKGGDYPNCKGEIIKILTTFSIVFILNFIFLILYSFLYDIILNILSM